MEESEPCELYVRNPTTTISISKEVKAHLIGMTRREKTYDAVLRELLDLPQEVSHRPSKYNFEQIKDYKVIKYPCTDMKERDRLYWAAKQYCRRHGTQFRIKVYADYVTLERKAFPSVIK